MKNIHLLPTTQDSWLCLKDGELVNANDGGCMLGYDPPRWLTQHIFITSDEEIKEGDWFLDETFKPVNLWFYPEKLKGKIILTTDQDLIKDGVQAIEDKFLEWFVKNPSCDFVEVERGYLGMWGFCKSSEIISKDKIHYKIIIPKEEPKQETLEEFIDKVDTPTDFDQFTFDEGIRVGAKWQQERMYSEEDMREAIRTSFLLGVDRGNYSKELEDKLIEQFKKDNI